MLDKLDKLDVKLLKIISTCPNFSQDIVDRMVIEPSRYSLKLRICLYTIEVSMAETKRMLEDNHKVIYPYA